MRKYYWLSRRSSSTPRPWDIHPIWRGIGCILFLISPFLAYLIADLLVQMNLEKGWYPISRELTRSISLPVVDKVLRHFFANLMVTALLLLLGCALIMVIYTIIYALIGPEKYGPLDEPPIRRKTRPGR